MREQLDLLVIHPGAQHGIYGELGDEFTAIEPPLWARIVAAYCRRRGYSVEILDSEALGISAQAAATQAIKINPRLVCLAVYGHQPSASTQQMTAAGEIAREIKRQTLAHIPVIMLGGHVSALPERTLLEERADYIAVGEGPETVAQLLDNDMPELDIPGLGRRRWDGIQINPAAQLLDINELQGDAWDLLPELTKYRAHNWQCLDGTPRSPYASIHTTLGCPYKCSFCCINAPFGGNRYRMRNPSDVVHEIMLLCVHGVRAFKIVDEMFILNEQHYTAIAQGIIDAGLGDELNIWAYARIDTIKPRTLDLLRRAGFKWLALGIESGSEHVRDGAEKKFGKLDIVSNVRTVQHAGINVIANYIFGLPDDDDISMRETLGLARLLNTEWANFYSAMAYPGSRLYAEAVQSGAALPTSWRGYSQHNDDCRPLDTKHVSGKEVLAFRDYAFHEYFSGSHYLNMIERKFGAFAGAQVRRMLKYKLPRKLLAA